MDSRFQKGHLLVGTTFLWAPTVLFPLLFLFWLRASLNHTENALPLFEICKVSMGYAVLVGVATFWLIAVACNRSKLEFADGKFRFSVRPLPWFANLSIATNEIVEFVCVPAENWNAQTYPGSSSTAARSHEFGWVQIRVLSGPPRVLYLGVTKMLTLPFAQYLVRRLNEELARSRASAPSEALDYRGQVRIAEADLAPEEVGVQTARSPQPMWR